MQRRVRAARSGALATEGLVTRILIGLNIAVFLVNLSQGASPGRNGGRLFEDWLLIAQGQSTRRRRHRRRGGPVVPDADRGLPPRRHHPPRLQHVLPLDHRTARWSRCSGAGATSPSTWSTALAGSAGALVFSPNSPTVGASGALFGILGAAVVFERQGHHVLGGQALGIALINFMITFLIPNISIGGHLGGFVGGILCAASRSPSSGAVMPPTAGSAPPASQESARSPSVASRSRTSGSAATRSGDRPTPVLRFGACCITSPTSRSRLGEGRAHRRRLRRARAAAPLRRQADARAAERLRPGRAAAPLERRPERDHRARQLGRRRARRRSRPPRSRTSYSCASRSSGRGSRVGSACSWRTASRTSGRCGAS